jgi:adenine-specific DNA-methyltransferase
MEKLKLHTPDLTVQNIDKLAQLFPNCVTEATGEDGKLTRAIDFDQLRQELSGSIVEGPQERYHLDWPGKREAILAANAPIAKTLRPCRAESVDFDTTKNLFIEGDNLDALKLLQETYLDKVKVIFIDPPYNTGSDFIYRDNFSESSESYFLRSNQRDQIGNRLVQNTEANGRFHSDWLSMIYPRLKLSWNLLAEDGLIAVTINDKEVFQLGKVMDEIFGVSSLLACAPWLSEASGGKEKTGLRTGHEFILIYFKRTSGLISREEHSVGDLDLNDVIGPYRKGRELMKWGGNSLRKDRPNQFYKLPTPGGDMVLPYRNDGMEGHWRWGKDNSEIKKAMTDPSVFHWELRPFDNGVSVEEKSERWVPYEKIRDETKRIGWSTWLDKAGTNAEATRELKDLFGFKPFDTPKPTSLIKWALNLHSDQSGIVLDFFAGSASTAQAVMSLNGEDGGTRRFILVQLDEALDPESAGYKAGFRSIADVGKERIRLAGSKLISEPTLTAQNLDNGFRVLKIDSSNMRDVYYAPDAVAQATLLGQVDNIKPDRTPEDLLFQVLVDEGVDLALPIAEETIAGKKVFFVDGNALAACFDDGITDELVKEIAKRQPLKAVFRDANYGSDSVKINVDQIFRLLSPDTEVKSI